MRGSNNNKTRGGEVLERKGRRRRRTAETEKDRLTVRSCNYKCAISTGGVLHGGHHIPCKGMFPAYTSRQVQKNP